MRVISGFEKDVQQFLEIVKKIWEKEGSKPSKGSSMRYQIIIGSINQRAAFVPTVSTKEGTEIVLIWNLEQEGIKKIEDDAKKMEIPLSVRPYVWFDEPPSILPHESQEK